MMEDIKDSEKTQQNAQANEVQKEMDMIKAKWDKVNSLENRLHE